MQVLKGRSRIIARIAGSQVLMMIFGLSVTLPTQKNIILMVGANVLSAGLYFFLIYSFMFAEGERDAVKANRLAPSQVKATGPAVMVAANLLNILLWLVFTIGQLIKAITSASSSLDFFIGVIDTILNFLYSVFLGFSLLLNREGSTNPLVYLLYIAVTILIGILAYRNGFKGFSILKKLGLDSNTNEDSTKK